jgi:hypothetical protein
MSGDVSKPWPFKSTGGAAKTDQVLINIRQRAIALLRTQKRAIHTGELATLLEVPTHQVQLALHEPLRDNAVRFSSSEGWDLVQPQALMQTRDGGQGTL